MLIWKVPVQIGTVSLCWDGESSASFDIQTKLRGLDPWELVFKAPSPNFRAWNWGQDSTGKGTHTQFHSIDIPFSKSVKHLVLRVHSPVPLSWRKIMVGGYEASMIPKAFLNPPGLLTEVPNLVSVSASDSGEGHLTVKSILTEGDDYTKDRWVVSPENIGGAVWVRIDFAQNALMTKVVLDWSGEYADDYELQVGTTDDWKTIRQSPDKNNIGVETTGKLPDKDGFLHHVHTIRLPMTHQPTRSLRLFIRNPATAWGLSLWQIRVYGYKL
jgi:F5/8 type C domain